MKMIGYMRCSTCVKAKKYLENHHIPVTFIDIVTETPSKEEIAQYHVKSGLPIQKLFNTSGKKYRELGLGKTWKNMSQDEIYTLLASDGMLIKRPILITDKTVLFGFKEEEYQKNI